jgi:cytochrome c-type biogenesis protein CcmH
MALRAWLIALALLACLIPTDAIEPGERLADPALEARARSLSAGLRCLVCQNQSIDDSNAPLAKDLRLLVREQVAAGRTDREVMEFVVARYGEFVLLRPPVGWHTLLLWATPLLVLAGALAAVWFGMRTARDRDAMPAPLSEDERKRLERLLAKDR